jgi:signal transduction histidine kinase
MTRRLVVALVGMVAAALVLAGLGTLGLARAGAEDALEDELATQAEALAAAAVLSSVRVGPASEGTFAERFEAMSSTLAADGTGIVLVPTEGETLGSVPAPLTLDDVDVERVLAGETQVGTVGDEVFAAAAGERSPHASVLVVVTRERQTVLRGASRWFLLASTATVLLAALVAVVLGRRLVRPVVAAAEATEQIARGDLSARLPPPPSRRKDELAELTRSVNQMAEALERSRGLDQQFLLSVSHDLRTPLTSIRGYAEAISDGAVHPEVAAETIQRESQRLQRLVQDLLDLATLDARTFSLRPEPTDAARAATEVVDGLRTDGASADVHLVVQAPDRPAWVLADPDRLAQVVANLVENALKFAKGQVTVVVDDDAPSEGWVTLAVHDDGTGIDPEDLPHVFERLYVAEHVPVRKEVGSGLGLAIVHELVTAMGGSVHVASTRGDGTTFRVQLPFAPAEADQTSGSGRSSTGP